MAGFDDEEYESFDLDDGDPRVAAVAEAGVDEDETDEDETDDDDELEDAAEDEIDFVIAAYREDGQLAVQTLAKDLANDFEELIRQLRRLPGDAGAIGFVSLVEEVFVIARVRGQNVQVLLNDGTAVEDWPIAHDVAEYLGVLDDDDEDDDEPLGDIGLLADLGLSDFDMGAIIDNLELGSDQMLIEIADKININPLFRKAVEAEFAG